jgi:hypothetical protein
MKTDISKSHLVLWVILGASLGVVAAQESKPSTDASAQAAVAQKDGREYSGMYSFLKDGEFVQVTVEDDGRVTGFISRYGDDKVTFVDQFFKTGKIDGNKLNFTTKVVSGLAFDFKGTVERGEGKNPGDEDYFVLKGTLSENLTDANKKTASSSREVEFKGFPQDAGTDTKK